MTYRRFTYRPGAFFGIFAQVMQPSWVSERSMNVSAPEALSREHAMLTRLLLATDYVVNNAMEDRNTDPSPINIHGGREKNCSTGKAPRSYTGN